MAPVGLVWCPSVLFKNKKADYLFLTIPMAFCGVVCFCHILLLSVRLTSFDQLFHSFHWDNLILCSFLLLSLGHWFLTSPSWAMLFIPSLGRGRRTTLLPSTFSYRIVQWHNMGCSFSCFSLSSLVSPSSQVARSNWLLNINQSRHGWGWEADLIMGSDQRACVELVALVGWRSSCLWNWQVTRCIFWNFAYQYKFAQKNKVTGVINSGFYRALWKLVYIQQGQKSKSQGLKYCTAVMTTGTKNSSKDTMEREK